MRRLAVLAVLCGLGLLFAAPSAAAAHPLGNFTVNHFNRLTLHQDRIDLHAVVDLAEIPSVQEQPAVDGDYARQECARFAAAATVTVDGRPGR